VLVLYRTVNCLVVLAFHGGLSSGVGPVQYAVYSNGVGTVQ
jgi:hypothetical protein